MIQSVKYFDSVQSFICPQQFIVFAHSFGIMDNHVIKCCVGEYTNSDCFKQSYVKSNHKKVIELTELHIEDQRIIKLRVGSEHINTICLHHQCVFFTYFKSTVLKTNFCCDPKTQKKVVGDKLISLHLSDSVYAATNTLRLIPGYKICKHVLNSWIPIF